MSFSSSFFLHKIREQEGRKDPAWRGWYWWEEEEGGDMLKESEYGTYTCNGKMISIQTVPGMGRGGGDEGEQWRG
jgi:hypothetical protein